MTDKNDVDKMTLATLATAILQLYDEHAIYDRKQMSYITLVQVLKDLPESQFYKDMLVEDPLEFFTVAKETPTPAPRAAADGEAGEAGAQKKKSKKAQAPSTLGSYMTWKNPEYNPFPLKKSTEHAEQQKGLELELNISALKNFLEAKAVAEGLGGKEKQDARHARMIDLFNQMDVKDTTWSGSSRGALPHWRVVWKIAASFHAKKLDNDFRSTPAEAYETECFPEKYGEGILGLMSGATELDCEFYRFLSEGDSTYYTLSKVLQDPQEPKPPTPDSQQKRDAIIANIKEWRGQTGEKYQRMADFAQKILDLRDRNIMLPFTKRLFEYRILEAMLKALPNRVDMLDVLVDDPEKKISPPILAYADPIVAASHSGSVGVIGYLVPKINAKYMLGDAEAITDRRILADAKKDTGVGSKGGARELKRFKSDISDWVKFQEVRPQMYARLLDVLYYNWRIGRWDDQYIPEKVHEAINLRRDEFMKTVRALDEYEEWKRENKRERNPRDPYDFTDLFDSAVSPL